MADTKISALTDGVTAEAADRLPAARGSPSNVWITPEYLREYIAKAPNTFERGLSITPPANENGLAISNFSLTGSNAQSLLSLSGTWNTSGAPTGIYLSITNTASNGGKLIDLRVDGNARFVVDTGGVMQTNFAIISGYVQAGSIFMCRSDTASYRFGVSDDLVLTRDAANVLAQRNGTNAQAFRVYNTYTDASNYERGFLRWASNTLEIGSEAAGTGSARNVEFYTAGFLRLRIASTGPTTIYAGLLLQTSDLLRFGGTTSSYPALKRNSAALQARLADDSAFAVIQGSLQTDANAVAETPTATHTLTIKDASGTTYKVLAVPA